MALSIIHNGRELTKEEMEFISQTLIDNWNNKLSKKQALININLKLEEFKQLQNESKIETINTNHEICENKKLSDYACENTATHKITEGKQSFVVCSECLHHFKLNAK